MSRILLSATLLFLTISLSGCGGGVSAEASGEAVPADYKEQQMASQQKAMEEAMKNAKK